MCGENLYTQRVTHYANGSSPRVRGKPVLTLRAVDQVRLIPACAGKTRDERPTARPTPAHPRVCGENSGQRDQLEAQRGSSPRVRGKLPFMWLGFWCVRLIPACAGKTVLISYCPRPDAAHPRVCGENWGRGCGRGRRPGSSPRVRGKLESVAAQAHPCGLIPACAGKTGRHQGYERRAQAHPRVCGENVRGR